MANGSIYEGDPKLFLQLNGSFLNVIGGQPEMDKTLWNAALISLNTREGWAGNALVDTPAEKIGSQYESTTELNLSVQMINQVKGAAERALKWITDQKLADKITVTVRNPKNHNLETVVIIEKDGEIILQFVLLKNEVNWYAQEIV
jgi:phage gp46-like protein